MWEVYFARILWRWSFSLIRRKLHKKKLFQVKHDKTRKALPNEVTKSTTGITSRSMDHNYKAGEQIVIATNHDEDRNKMGINRIGDTGLVF